MASGFGMPPIRVIAYGLAGLFFLLLLWQLKRSGIEASRTAAVEILLDSKIKILQGQLEKLEQQVVHLEANSARLFSGEIVVGGEFMYYPIRFNVTSQWMSGRSVLEINRIRGAAPTDPLSPMYARFTFHTSGWGHGASFLEAEIFQDELQPLLADYVLPPWSNCFVVWLLGGKTSYYYSATGAILADKSPTAKVGDYEGYVQQEGGEAFHNQLEVWGVLDIPSVKLRNNGLNIHHALYLEGSRIFAA